ncbi:MAG: hypothetical protein GEU73_10850 [Chloroflexi bacterium]|nr:hypothetical protein [Chloroflexota bacterium]
MGRMVREFMTHWDDKSGPIWFERDEDELVGTQRAGGRPMPRLRMIDLFRGPTNALGGKPVLVWDGEDGVIEAQHVVGPEAAFHRPSDYDVLVFQYAGHAAAETEMGEFRLAPSHCLHIPAGVAYRIVGDGNCRQMVVKLRKPVSLGVDADHPYTETVFEVHTETEGANGHPVGFPKRQGKILEVTEFFRDGLEPIVMERDHAALVGCVSGPPGRPGPLPGGRKVTVIPVFDYFTGTTGVGGGVRAPQHYEGEEFRTDSYNTEGEQFGFHRGCDDDELWFQFRGHAKNDTEWGAHELDACEMGYVPRGIAHRITGGPGFLRFVLYFRHPMHPKVDESSQTGRTEVDVETVSRRELPALAEARAKMQAAAAAGGRPGR